MKGKIMNFAFPTTGDSEKDDEIARGFKLRQSRMNNNVCPNGCAQMKWIDAYNRECGICGFSGFSTKPFDMKSFEA